MTATTMVAKDTISAKMAECYMTYDGNRYNLMNAINLEAKIEFNKADVPILGKTAKGKKPNGWTGTGSATFHFNNSILRRMIHNYKIGGAIYFDMEIVNSDPATTNLGSQIVKLKNCSLDSAILAKFDASSDEVLEEDLEFSFDDFEYAQGFKHMSGFKLTN